MSDDWRRLFEPEAAQPGVPESVPEEEPLSVPRREKWPEEPVNPTVPEPLPSDSPVKSPKEAPEVEPGELEPA